uniref:Putative homing endonuclease n=1 Tax=viral metagenome TaxID=1070528 RepID=A0A6M3LD76_9ZZZZ
MTNIESKNPMDDAKAEMGNPQERSLAWLAGIVDGEGSITTQAWIMKDGNLRLTPFVSIGNTDEAIVLECKRILDSLGIKNRWQKIESENKWIGRVDGEKAVLAIIDALYDYLISYKKHNCDVIRKYIEMRHAMRFKHDGLGRITRQPYTKDQIQLVSSIRTSRNAKSSETLCRAANVVG